jgi:hypothetical protein
LEAAWKVTAEFLGHNYYENKSNYFQSDYEQICDKVHWAMFASQVQNYGS